MVVIDVPVASIFVQVDAVGQPINPRGPVNDTTDLQASIKAEGLIEPLTIRWMPGAKATAYLLVHGERRLTAVRALGWQTVPCVVKRGESTPEDDIMTMIAADTAQPYPPLYLAKAFVRLRDSGKTMKQIANAWGRTADQVSAIIQLLDAAPVAQQAVMEGRMGMSVFSLVKHLPPHEQAEIIGGAGDTVSMRYAKEWLRRRKARLDAVSTPQPAPVDANGHGAATAVSATSSPATPTITPTHDMVTAAKVDYNRALTAVRSVKQAMQDGRLPANYDDWPVEVQVLHRELTAALDSIRPFGEQPDAPKRKPAPVFL